MINKICEKVLVNGFTEDKDKLNKKGIFEKESIYEVIRIINKNPLFIEDHYERMIYSAKNAFNYVNLSFVDFKKNINNYISIVKKENFNIKILLNRELDFIILENPAYYPSKDEYNDGVKVKTYKRERQIPNLKKVDNQYKKDIENIIKTEEIFEVLLVNNNGYITEGSRSNVFFIRDNKIYSSPDRNVLMGITRKHLYSICNEYNILIKNSMIHVEDIDSFESAFISGTSINLLPVSMVNDYKFEICDFLKKLIGYFNNHVNKYLGISKK